MIDACEIRPQAIYDDGSLYALLGIAPGTLARARREQRLRYTRTGQRVLYLGQWVLDWLAADDRQEVASE